MRDRIEAALGRWGRFVYRRAGWVIAVVLLLAGGLATQMQHFYLDTTNEGMFHEDDPIRVRYEAFREVYGRETMVIVALRPRQGVFELGFLETLREIHEALEEEVPLIVEVNSLVNARDTRGYEDRLEVGDLLEDWPESPEDLERVVARVRETPFYVDNLISPDESITTISLETQAYVVDEAFDALAGFEETGGGGGGESGGNGVRLVDGADDARISQAIYDVVERYQSDDLEIHVAGVPAFTSKLALHMQWDMARLTGLCILLIVVFLGLLFHRVGAVLLPIFTVSVAVVATLALMAAVGVPLMPPTQIIPPFLLAVGVGSAVHLLAIFYQARRRGEDEESAVSYALAHSGLPIIMAALTTAGGLLSFAPAALRPTSHFGIFTPSGVVISLFLTLTLLPALIAVFPMRASEPRSGDSLSQRLLLRVGAFSTRYPRGMVLFWALLLVTALVGTTRLNIGHHILGWFPDEDPMYKASVLINEQFGGAGNYEVIVSTGEEDGLKDPELLARMDELQSRLLEVEEAGIVSRKSVALTDVLKETHKALNANQHEFYRVPDDRALIAQELLLFENSGSDDMEDLVDSQYSSGRMSMRLPLVDASYYHPYFDAVVPELRRILGPDVEIEITGIAHLVAGTVNAALDTMISSYLSAFVVITILMVLLIGRLGMGLVSMVPNLSPIILTLGLMGWTGIQLDMFTLMVGTIAIGLAVDDTIHFMHNFRRYFDQTGDTEEAVRSTLRSTGQAMLYTTLVLAAGFLVFTQAYMENLWYFGILVTCSISLAFIADVTLAPALVTLLWGRREKAASA